MGSLKMTFLLLTKKAIVCFMLVSRVFLVLIVCCNVEMIHKQVVFGTFNVIRVENVEKLVGKWAGVLREKNLAKKFQMIFGDK